MNTPTTSLRSLLLGRPRAARGDVDPADMGTCFGLEMTLTALPTGEPAAPARPRPKPTLSWWQRFSPRKVKPA